MRSRAMELEREMEKLRTGRPMQARTLWSCYAGVMGCDLLCCGHEACCSCAGVHEAGA